MSPEHRLFTFIPAYCPHLIEVKMRLPPAQQLRAGDAPKHWAPRTPRGLAPYQPTPELTPPGLQRDRPYQKASPSTAATGRACPEWSSPRVRPSRVLRQGGHAPAARRRLVDHRRACATHTPPVGCEAQPLYHWAALVPLNPGHRGRRTLRVWPLKSAD